MAGTRKEMYRLLSKLLAYPRADLAAEARRCQGLMAKEHPEAAALMGQLVDFVESTPRERLEEIYTGAFDLEPSCTPYVGYQLFGENPKRGLLMVRLRESYRSHGFEAESEIPDHLAVLFRFLSEMDDQELEQDMRGYILGPALKKMSATMEKGGNGYGKLLRSALLVCGEPAEEALAAGMTSAPIGTWECPLVEPYGGARDV